MKLLQRSLALVCLILLFIFCVSNGEPMSVRFLTWESVELPVFLLLIFAFLTGAVLALIGQSLRSVAHPTDKQTRRDKKLERKKQEEALKLNSRHEQTDAKPGVSESVDAENEGEK